eukprot:gene6754-7513_t
MSLSSAYRPLTKSDCTTIPDLNVIHTKICLNKPQAVKSIGLGVQIAVDECQRQFRKERWNCPTVSDDTEKNVFGQVLDIGTKETAFVHAITSAGVVFSVTRSCSAGMFPDCEKCDTSKRGHVDKSGEWKWGDCNDNVFYGAEFAEKFIDSSEKYAERIRRSRKKYLKRVMNLHNNKAGRLALLDSMMSVCGCTGVSGSCATKVCRKIMSPFKRVGESLKLLHQRAVKVSAKRRGRKQIREAKNALDDRQLMFFDKSPNYCFPDKAKGVLGTSGRVCNVTSSNMDSCRLLCCGQGYNIQIKRSVKRCNCKFKWCCNVDCEICESLDKVHTCK